MPIYLRIFSFFLLSMFIAGFISINPTSAQEEAKKLASTVIFGKELAHPKDIEAIYAQNNYEPLWLGRRGQGVNNFIEKFDDSWKHGFNPTSYHVDALKKFAATPSPDYMTVQNADILLTDAIIRYGRDLTGARINPKDLSLHSPSVRKPASSYEIINYIKLQNNTVEALDNLAPQGNLYKTLQNELAELTSSPQISQPELQLSGLIKPRTNHPLIPEIRARLGGVPADSMQGPQFYDDAMQQKIVTFQELHGLKADGVIGPQTLRFINLSNGEKIKKILVNMERIRWEDQTKPDRYIMVNIPSETLWAVEGSNIALQMPVVVGKPTRPTKSFNAKIRGVRFNPTWTLPPTIKKEDFIAKAKKDPSYIANRGLKVYRDGQLIDSTAVDWSSVNDSNMGAYRMVQSSGDNNPLGRYRLLMDNPYNIYLHDTPSKSLFTRSDRALSSGCVRMMNASDVANFVLAPNNGWSTEREQEILSTGRETEIAAANPLPVYLLYRTAWIGDNGGLIYGHDMYSEDDALYALMKRKGLLPQNI